MSTTNSELSLLDVLRIAADAKKKETFAERDFYRDRALKPLSANSLGMGRDVLSSAIFGISRGERKRVEVSLTSFRGKPLHYRGPELRQDDARVLEFLIHGVRKLSVSAIVGFDPCEFVGRLGWSTANAAYSTARLQACIERMQESVLKIGRPGSSFSAQLIGSFEESNGTWFVQLHETVLNIFDGERTFLPVKERRALRDGLQSWLAGFLRANDDETLFKFEALHSHSGSHGGLKEFSRDVRDSMKRLQEMGVVKTFKFSRGALKVERGD